MKQWEQNNLLENESLYEHSEDESDILENEGDSWYRGDNELTDEENKQVKSLYELLHSPNTTRSQMSQISEAIDRIVNRRKREKKYSEQLQRAKARGLQGSEKDIL